MTSQEARLGASGRDETRPHHISSIAHMFFTDERPDRGVAQPAVREVGVAAAGCGCVSAWAAATLAWCLAQDSPDAGRICLAEPLAAADSALAWLPHDSRDGPGPPTAAGVVTLALSSRGAEPDPCERPWIRWRNFGVPSVGEISAWEQIDRAPPLAGLRSTTWSGLVWCLRESETERLDAAFALGRLASVMQPARIEMLVVPDVEMSFRRDSPGTAAGFALARLHELVAAAAPGVAYAVTLVPRGDEGGLALPPSDAVAPALTAAARRAAGG